jgi:hypothetical protein
VSIDSTLQGAMVPGVSLQVRPSPKPSFKLLHALIILKDPKISLEIEATYVVHVRKHTELENHKDTEHR